MSIMTQLEFELDFSDSEKNIARYILDKQEDILDLAIKELAKKTYTSPATIVRLCHKLGLQGYGDFKIKFSAELQAEHKIKNRIDVNYPFTKEDDSHQVAYKLASLNQESIEDTLSLINFKELEEIINKIDNASHIFIFGSGNSILAALEFQHKMLRIGKFIELRELTGEQIFLVYNCNPDDIAIIISYSGETSELINFASLLKNQKVPIIGITSLGDNQLSKYCQYILNTGSREKIFNKIAPFSSKTSITFLLDMIFSLIFQKKYDDYINIKLQYDKSHDHRHPIKSPINDEEV